MIRTLAATSLLLFIFTAVGQDRPSGRALSTAQDGRGEPAYDSAGRLRAPADYREWIFLTSGLDMSYDPKPETDGMSMFDNVFVNPAAYRAFVATGTWPDKTMLVLESRGAEGASSINKKGHTQGRERMGFEVHVRDEAKTPGGWAFYSFDGGGTAEQIPTSASCYTCHQQHAAVATTFVQFYPTMMPIATAKKTLSAEYLRETEGPRQK